MAEHFWRKLHCVRINTISSSTPENKAPPCTTYIPVISSKASTSPVTLSEPFSCLYLKSAAFVFSWQREAPRGSCTCPSSQDQLRALKIPKFSVFNAHPWPNHGCVSGCTSAAAPGSWTAFSPWLVLSAWATPVENMSSGGWYRCGRKQLLHQKGFPWKMGHGQQLIPSLPCKRGQEGLCKPHLPETYPGSHAGQKVSTSIS